MGSNNAGPADEGQAAGEKAAAEVPPTPVGNVAGEEDSGRLAEQLEEQKKRLLYLQADFENYRKRVEREKAEFRALANEGLILDLLDVYENLGRALEAAKKPEAQAPQISSGLEMVHGQMRAILERYGLKPIATVGRPFDPRTMEAMLQEPSGAEEDTVLEEFQRGYTLNSKVIRCAKVKVSRK